MRDWGLSVRRAFPALGLAVPRIKLRDEGKAAFENVPSGPSLGTTRRWAVTVPTPLQPRVPEPPFSCSRLQQRRSPGLAPSVGTCCAAAGTALCWRFRQKSYAVGNTQQVAFIYFKGFAFKRGALGNPACLVTSLGLLLLPPRCKRTQHPALPPGAIRAEKLGSDPSFSHMEKKKKKKETSGCECKTCHPRGLSLSGCTARVGGNGSGGGGGLSGK